MEDKIKISLTYRTHSLLISDMEEFGFMRGDEVNRNAFLNTLVVSFFAIKKEMAAKLEEAALASAREVGIPKEKADRLVERLLPLLDKRSVEISEKKLRYVLSFRPNKECRKAIAEIEESYLANRSMADYLRSLFEDYATFSPAERERILFHDRVLEIQNAIDKRRAMTFLLNGEREKFIPGKIVPSKGEFFTYVVGFRDGLVSSIHLYKFAEPLTLREEHPFTPKEKETLKLALESGPDYLQSERVVVKARLTKKGNQMLRRFWMGRPDKVGEEDGITIFEGPYVQMFNYFARLGKEASIIEPRDFRSALKAFHYGAIKSMKEGNDD